MPIDPVVPFRFNSLSFDYVAVEPARPQNVEYQYKLEGHDKEWSPLSNENRVTYGNLFEGSYQFMLKAKSPYGIWSESITYPFRVLPPWYRTWWAYLIYLASFLSILYIYIRFRTSRLQKQIERIEVMYEAAERFVPRRFLELLGRDNIEIVKLGDSAQLTLTGMFADIRGFTTLSEALTVQQISEFLNLYTGKMAPIIRHHHGFVNLFLGDGILALFPESPSNAVDAAVAMIEALPSFDKEMKEHGFPPLKVGISINTGDVMLLALGEKERMEASVVSDAINTASRIEGLNKIYKTQILITETVYKKLSNPGKYLIRQVDRVRLRGKKESKIIYEVKAFPAGEAKEKEIFYLSLYQEAFHLYESGDFVHAEEAFKQCHIIKPEDACAEILIKRCRHFQKVKPPHGWDGTVESSFLM